MLKLSAVAWQQHLILSLLITRPDSTRDDSRLDQSAPLDGSSRLKHECARGAPKNNCRARLVFVEAPSRVLTASMTLKYRFLSSPVRLSARDELTNVPTSLCDASQCLSAARRMPLAFSELVQTKNLTHSTLCLRRASKSRTRLARRVGRASISTTAGAISDMQTLTSAFIYLCGRRI